MGDASLPRRRFLRTFVLATAYSRVFDADWFGTVLAEVKLTPRPTLGILRLNVTDFPALSTDFGSVRIGTSRLAANVPIGIFYPLLINRAPGGQFHALNSECSHAGCALPAYNRLAGSSTCPCHGSRFGIDGQCLSGPASFPLQSYRTTFDGTNALTVEIPDWPHEVVGSVVEGGGTPSPRFRLTFLAFANLEFEVLFRASLAHPWELVPFALSPNGGANQSVFPGIDDFATLYVDRTAESGFYAVAIRVKPV